jgi:hypothetical protein
VSFDCKNPKDVNQFSQTIVLVSARSGLFTLFPRKIKPMKKYKNLKNSETVVEITVFRLQLEKQAKDHPFQINMAFVQTIPDVSKDRRGTGRFRAPMLVSAVITLTVDYAMCNS